MVRRIMVVLAMVLAMVPMVAHSVDVPAGAVEVSGFSDLRFSSSNTKAGGSSSSDETSYQAWCRRSGAMPALAP
jgi:hypothetical protein